MENNSMGDSASTVDGRQSQEQSGGGRLHWTTRPARMLLAVLAAEFFIYLLTSALSLLSAQIFSRASSSELDGITVLLNALVLCPALVVSVLFYWLVRRSQLRHGTAEAVSWKPGVAFWVGVALTLLYIALSGIQFLINYSANAAMLLYSTVVNGFSLALLLGLLFPVLEKRFGACNGALVLSAAFALLTLLEQLITSTFSVLQYASETGGMGGQVPWGHYASGIVYVFITAASLWLLRSALYLAASRRMTGTWLLLSSVPGLVRAIGVSLPGNSSGLSELLQTLCIQFPYYLLVFVLSLAALAGFQR